MLLCPRTSQLQCPTACPVGLQSNCTPTRISDGGTGGGWDNKGKIGCHLGLVLDSCRVWQFHIPETNGTQETDTADFFPKCDIPHMLAAEQITEALNDIQDASQPPMPPHANVTESDKMKAVICCLAEMCKGNNEGRCHTRPETRTEPKWTGNALPRVNQHPNRKPQKCKMGTRVKVTEVEGRGKKCCLGTATAHNPISGLCHVEFHLTMMKCMNSN